MFKLLLYAAWVVAPAMQSAIGLRMWARRAYRDYPLFFTYTVAALVRFFLLFYSYHSGNRDLYRQAYSTSEALDVALSFAVVCELFWKIFQTYDGIRELGSAMLRWASVILMVIAAVVAAASSGSDSDRFLAGFFALERSVEIVRGGFLFLLFTLSASLGLRWKQGTLGIALGFAVVTSVNLAAYTLRAEMGFASQDVLSLISSAGYDCAVLIWLFALYAQKPEHHFEHRVQSWDVDSWNRALLDLLRR
jgi:hypothetical protein